MSPSASGAAELYAQVRNAGRTWRAAVVAVLTGVFAVYLCGLFLQAPGYSFWVDGVAYNAVFVASMLVCLGRAVFVTSRRVPFALMGLTALMWVAGNGIYSFHDQFLVPVPYPSLADAAYLSSYVLLITGVLAMAYPEVKGLSLGAFLDGALAALACAAAGSVLIVEPALADLGGSVLTQVVGAAYPVLDLALVAVTVAVIVLKHGQVAPTWIWLTAGVAIEAVVDTVYLHQVATGAYHVGEPMDALWPLALVFIAVAATCVGEPVQLEPRPAAARQAQVLPNLFILGSFALLSYGSLEGHWLPTYALVLTSLGLLAALQRTAMGISTLRMLDISRRQAQTDELTQLSNRRHFDQAVQQALHQRAPSARVAMMMLDLNGFKAVNDIFGHHVGDEVLRQVAARLRTVVRAGDVLARLGGDEFALLLNGCSGPDALVIGERMVTEIAHPMLIDGYVHTCGASIGIAACPEDGIDMATLMQRADVAMLDAKSTRAGPTSFDPARHRGEAEQLNVREALERHELFLHYQPQYDCRSGRMSGVEALVRWNHPTRGLLFPDTFLSFFEQAGMMGELTIEVLQIAAAARRQWSQQGSDLDLSINVAPSALNHGGLVRAVAESLKRFGLPATALVLEITEDAMLADLERSRLALLELSELGVQLSLDDFGTGYCSLTYLRNLPLSEVKIDRSFVMELTAGSRDATIVASSLRLVRELGLRSVAEGVETVEALNLLRLLGCDLAQGYLLARPMPAEQILGAARRLTDLKVLAT